MNGVKLCREFMHGKCTRDKCKFEHIPNVCFHFWKNGTCKFGDNCKNQHLPNLSLGPNVMGKDKYNKNTRRKNHPKNTESFEPLDRPVDMRVVCDLGKDKLTTPLTSRDVVLVPNLFSDYKSHDLYNKLVYEIEHCGVPEDQLLKLWHGDTHYIADDHTPWKKNAPTFAMVIERIRAFFDMDIQATRFNWYKDTSQWKAFHRDAAAIKPEKAKVQNFTVAVSFGATRDAAFEEHESANTQKRVISMPQPDGWIYCFAKDTNVLWKHGILKDKETRPEGRISIICWGSVQGQTDVS